MEYVDLYLIYWPIAVKPGKPQFPLKSEDIMPMDLAACGGRWRNAIGLALLG
jgi:hypothetical protein